MEWHSWSMTRQLEKTRRANSATCYKFRSASIAGLQCVKSTQRPETGVAVCNDCIEGEEPEFDAGGEG